MANKVESKGPRARRPTKKARRVAPDTVVTIAYRLFAHDGTLLDEVKRDAPLEYVHGYAQVIPGLDAGLDGAVAGDRRTLRLDPPDAFGDPDPDARIRVERDDLSYAHELAVGDQIVAEAADGSELTVRVVAFEGDEVVLDCNHPLAGQRVRFEVEVCDVRPATEAEIESAQHEVDERIAHQSSIVYDAPGAGLSEGAGDAGVSSDEPSLVKLRPKPPAEHEEP